MAKFVFNDYGFECPFVAEGDEIEDVFKEYWIHTADEHGIGYQKEVLM